MVEEVSDSCCLLRLLFDFKAGTVASLFALGFCKEVWRQEAQIVAKMVSKSKKNQNAKGNRLLISVSVIGSSGPVRFIVNEDDLVGAVIDTALQSYAREGRLPIIGLNPDEFLLYCSNGGSDAALNPWDRIGSQGIRNFVLHKRPQAMEEDEDGKSIEAMTKGCVKWKSWFNRSLTLKISSH